ncbi:MAG: hypothetical protein K2X47_18970 [Bdellovibrionales bacterium]|nr:hypothetical protein [Bdellovibrionales bacterium]
MMGAGGRIKMRHGVFLLVLLVSVGCSKLAPQSSESSSAAQAPGATPPLDSENPPVIPRDSKSSKGKGGFGIRPGLAGRQRLTADDATRFLVYVPPGYKEEEPIGMVLVFHGVEGTDDPTAFFVVCANFANNDRFLLVSPQGDVRDGGSGSFAQPYVREIVEKVMGAFNVDYSKQYMVAVSGGVNPALVYAFSSKQRVYTNPFGQPMKVGYQSDFAAVGITSPGGGSENMLQGLESKTAAQLGFTPAFYADYGALSSNGPSAQTIADWARARGYTVTIKARPGEGHAPSGPYRFLVEMFDLFERTVKKESP